MTDTHVLSYRLPPMWNAALDGWSTWLMAAGATDATRKTRRAHVRSVANSLKTAGPADVTGADLIGVVGAPGLSAEHRRGMRASLTSFYRWCVAAGMVVDDPTVGLPTVRASLGAPKPATDEIWRQLMNLQDARVSLMVRLSGEAGLRRAEVAAIHTDDLHDGAGGAELIVHGKGGKQRVVPVTDALADAIRSHWQGAGFLFPGRVDGHISPDRVGHLVSAVMPPGWSMHKLRHRFASRAYSGTGNLRAVQEVLGHASVATTQRYTAVTSREIRAAAEAAGTIQKYSPRDNPRGVSSRDR